MSLGSSRASQGLGSDPMMSNMAVGQNHVPLVNIKIAGKWIHTHIDNNNIYQLVGGNKLSSEATITTMREQHEDVGGGGRRREEGGREKQNEFDEITMTMAQQ